MQRLFMFGCLAVGVLASGCAAASTTQSAEGPGSSAVSSTLAAHRRVPCRRSRHRVQARLTSAYYPTHAACMALGLRIDALPVGTHVEHTDQDALRAAAAANVGPTAYAHGCGLGTGSNRGQGRPRRQRALSRHVGSRWHRHHRDTQSRRAHRSAAQDVGASQGTVYRIITPHRRPEHEARRQLDCSSKTAVNSPEL